MQLNTETNMFIPWIIRIMFITNAAQYAKMLYRCHTNGKNTFHCACLLFRLIYSDLSLARLCKTNMWGNKLELYVRYLYNW